MPMLVFGLLVGLGFIPVSGYFYVNYGHVAGSIAALISFVGFVIAGLAPPINDAQRGNTPKTTRKDHKDIGHTHPDEVKRDTADPDDDDVDWSTYPVVSDPHHN